MISEAVESKIIGLDGEKLSIAERLNLQTEEINRKAEEKKQAVAEALQKEYQQALNAFISDESYFEDYANCEAQNREVLVKIFKFVPSEELKNNRALGTTQLYLPSDLNGNYTLKSTTVDDKIYPIVKIIKVGANVGKEDGKNVKVGDTWTVPNAHIDGDDWNPDFLHYKNTFAKASDGKQGIVHLPSEMRQKLPRVEIYWSKYLFHNPRSTTPDDNLIYLIPDILLKMKF